jgi:hypothetical protein
MELGSNGIQNKGSGGAGPTPPSGVLLNFPIPDQYTSYRTGDVGSRVQNNWFDYTPPSNPAAISELDYSSSNFWFLLKNNIKVGGVANKIRFVDVDGGQTFDSTGNKNLILVDKLTGIGIARTIVNSNNSWNNAITNALSHSIVVNGVTYDDWYLISIYEYIQLFQGKLDTSTTNFVDSATLVNLITFTLNAYWTSVSTNATLAIRMNRSAYFNGEANKTDNSGSIWITKQTMNLITAP